MRKYVPAEQLIVLGSTALDDLGQGLHEQHYKRIGEQDMVS